MVVDELPSARGGRLVAESLDIYLFATKDVLRCKMFSNASDVARLRISRGALLFGLSPHIEPSLEIEIKNESSARSIGRYNGNFP